MQFAAAILLTLGLIASPVGCMLQPCQVTWSAHDCCPRTAGLTACPYDILSSAKAAPSQHFTVATGIAEARPFPAPPRSSHSVLTASVMADQSGLHLENSVLRL
jgi:hypothetical protein